MVRTVKNPEERKREILDIAMRLFVENGYEAVSMRDIAHEADIAAGLCYHYFDSKQKLFAAALDAYVDEIVEDYIGIFDDTDRSFSEKLDALCEGVVDEESLRYHEFFHAKGNRALHHQLSFALCDRLYPHVLAALKADAKHRGVVVKDPGILVDFVIHGQVNLMAGDSMSDGRIVARIREYAEALIASQTVAAPGTETALCDGIAGADSCASVGFRA